LMFLLLIDVSSARRRRRIAPASHWFEDGLLGPVYA
jgi:hypothetical protein